VGVSWHLRYYNYSFLIYVALSAAVVGFYVLVYCLKVPVNRVPRLEEILREDPIIEESARRRFSNQVQPGSADTAVAKEAERAKERPRERFVLVATSGGRSPRGGHLQGADATEELERGALHLRLLAALK